MPPQRMQLDQTNSSTAFTTQPEQRPRRSTIHSTTRSHGPYREQRQRINSDLEADQDDEKPLPLDTFSSSSNSQPHRLHDSDGAASDQWNQHRPSGQSTGDSQDATPVSSPVFRTTGSTGKRSLQRPPPPRLPGHGRSQSDLNLESISPGLNRSVSSPLASPITATANSLTALTISSSGPYGVSGRDLSKITVPRERRATTTARPYSVCSTESLLTQDRMKNGFGVSHSTIHLNQLSDSEISSVHDHGTRGRGSKAKRSHVQPPPSPSLPTASQSSSSTKTPVGLKSPTMKPASQLRVTLYNLVSNGYLPAETLVVFREHSAIITAKGTLIPQMKEPDAMAIYPWLQDEYETPSAWATAMVKGGRTGKVAVNGWSAIKVPIHQDSELSKKYEGLGVAEASLDVFRKKYLAEMTDDGALAAADDTSSGRGGKDADSLDRKKRKRPLARSGEAAGLRVTTTGTRSYKGKTEPTRPRKRTVSDLSGMVSSDLLQDRQLRWEAAGVLFSMQDDLMSPTYDGFERRRTPYQPRWSRHKGIIPLESLERRRQEQESKRRHSSASRLSALRTLRPLSLVPVAIPLQLTSSMAHMEFCVLCGGSGSTPRSHRRHSNQSHQWSSAESTEPEVGDIKADRDVMRRCFDCGECYHMDCLPSDSPGDRDTSVLDESWRCPRCTTCRLCEKSVHEQPPASVSVGSPSSEAIPLVETDSIKALVCDHCHEFTHLQLLEEKGNVCPLCCTIYQDDDYETPMIFCDGCSHWVHVACDKGLEDRDYEELGEDSKQYICPSCIPTPIPSPALSSSSSILSTAHSNDESSWTGTCGHGLFGAASCFDCSKEMQAYNEDDWHIRSSKKKDDILDLLKAAKEISDSESRNTSPYTSYAPMFPTTHSRTMSTSLESVAEVAAAEALLTIFSGASTPISSTPYTSYPPSPFEPSFNGPYDRHYSVINSPNDHALLVGSMGYTPSSDQESTGSSRDRYGFPQEDYFNSRSYSRPTIPYHHIGQELELMSAQPKLPSRQEQAMEPGDVVMEEGRAGLQSPSYAVVLLPVTTRYWGVCFHSPYRAMAILDKTLTRLQHQGQSSNNAVVMDHKQRTILCSMHYREISTLNNLRSTAYALESSVPSSDCSAPSAHSNPLVPPVTLRTAWTGPYWIKNSLLALQNADAPESVVQETSIDGFRIGGLTIHTFGKFDSPESVYSETGLANDVDLEACYEMVSDKPLADLGPRDRVLALPLGFKCSRRIVLNEHRFCVTTAEVVQRRRQPQGSVETVVSTEAGDLAHPGSDELDTAWKIMMVFSGYGPPQDCEFFADSMQDAVDRIISFSSGDLDNEHQSSQQYGLYLHSADAFFGIDHPLVRNSIRAKKGEKEVASRMWTRYRQVRRAVDRQCSKGGCSNQSRRHQGRDSQEDDNSDWESTTAARVRLRTGSLLLRKRVSRIGIARGRDPSSSGAAELKDADIKETILVPGLLQELIKASTSTSSNNSPDGIAPTGSNKVALTKSHQQQERQDSLLEPEDEKTLPALEMNMEQLQTLRADQMKNVALFWNGRKMVSSQIRAVLTPVAQPSESPERQPLPAADGVDNDKEPSAQTPKGMEVDGTTQMHLYPGGSQAKQPSSTAVSLRLLPEAHGDVRVYTTCSFKSDEVIMEYTGEVVHPSIAVRRQESYQSQGRSCYMMWCEFQDAVIDATMRGGLARYIRNEHRHLRKQDNNPQQKRTVYARTVVGPGLQGPKVVICAAEPLETGTELILRYC
ncbi:hypothetical protein KI688_008274 [Linnemannia hyalina]|uniref:PHD-type domain-containing protein n=1 Tax=Linnemannia hyalina TaxID=64524 RepID=A0A9P8BVQ4_9FUNG|nr:hypothetical protein KI688_008274 [Linnemannia hyalina]